MDRTVGYRQPAGVEAVQQPAASAPAPITVADYRAGRVPPRPAAPKEATRSATRAAPETTPNPNRPATMPRVAAPAAARRQVGVAEHPGFSSGVVVVGGQTSEPLRYVKTDTSPLAEEARLTIDELQRRKQQQSRQQQDESDAHSWESV